MEANKKSAQKQFEKGQVAHNNEAEFVMSLKKTLSGEHEDQNRR
jgi:hypothetical protein